MGSPDAHEYRWLVGVAVFWFWRALRPRCAASLSCVAAPRCAALPGSAACAAVLRVCPVCSAALLLLRSCGYALPALPAIVGCVWGGISTNTGWGKLARLGFGLNCSKVNQSFTRSCLRLGWGSCSGCSLVWSSRSEQVLNFRVLGLIPPLSQSKAPGALLSTLIAGSPLIRCV